jgi:hypothetical protein
MFFKRDKVTPRVEQILNEMISELTDPMYSDYVRVINMAKNDLVNNKQAPQVVANKLTNTIYAKRLSGEAKLPEDVSAMIAGLRKFITSNGYGFAMISSRPITSRYE